MKTSIVFSEISVLALKILTESNINFFISEHTDISRVHSVNVSKDFNIKFVSVIDYYFGFQNINYLVNIGLLPKNFVDNFINRIKTSVLEIDGILYKINCIKDPHMRTFSGNELNAFYDFSVEPL
jgi:hypothetical protein